MRLLKHMPMNFARQRQCDLFSTKRQLA